MRKAFLYLLLAALLLLLCGCSAMPDETPEPDVRLLQRPVYEEETLPVSAPAASSGVFRLDLWLDASHTMGGINLNEESMYPHFNRKYAEGGFHYRYENTVGLYESLLRCMLSSAEGSRVRLLRFGDERLPDEYLLQSGVADAAASADQLRSLRRDMLTYAIDPMPGVFSAFSDQDMSHSFYALGSPMLNQLPSLNASLLENPSRKQSMTEALDAQSAAIVSGSAPSLTAIAQDTDYPLLYALDNLDLDRLSVVTFDPAALRRLTAVTSDGTPAALVEELLRKRGVFDAGLSAGLYAFTLDYVGQMSSFAFADLSEPMIWGEWKYNSGKNRSEGVLAMPRTLLTLVVGQPGQVERFVSAFDEKLAVNAALRELRGPQKGELTYARGGETITQQPFQFACEYMQLERPQLQLFTRHSEGVKLSGAQDGLITLDKQSSSFTLTIPFDDSLPALTGVQLNVQDALLLSHTLPNTPDAELPQDAQVIALRDRLYVYTHQQPSGMPFEVAKVDRSGGELIFTIQSSAEALEPGYYHLSLSADYAGGLSWTTPAWVNELSVSVTNEQAAEWKNFTNLMTQHERAYNIISRPFQHAWGPATDKTYHGMAYPDFPMVDKAPWLSELVRQLQSAAEMEQTPCVRYTFDVFVTNP